MQLIRRQRQQGSALIEVLIAVVLFAIGALGLLALNASMVSRGKASVDQTMAATLANDFLAAVRADGEKQLASGATFTLNSALVTDFTARVTSQLPAGTANVSTVDIAVPSAAVPAKAVNVVIGWKGPNDPDTRQYRSSTAVHP